MQKKVLEVEGEEIAIFSTKGIMAIVPKNKVNWVKKKLNEGCHECIDEFVKTLPDFDNQGQKAQDGVVMDTDPPVTSTPPANLPWINSQGQFQSNYSFPSANVNTALRPMTNEEKARYSNEQWRLPDSVLENIVELIDPSGLFSHDDAQRAYEQWKMSGRPSPTMQEDLDMFSAIPLLGKYSKIKYIAPGSGPKFTYKTLPWQELVNLFGQEGLYGPKNQETEESSKKKKESSKK
jgi:hypothetical protein